MKKSTRITPLDVVLIALFAAASLYCIYRVTVDLQYNWQWGTLAQYLVRLDGARWKAGSLTLGFLTTIKLSCWAMIMATLLGTFLGLLRTSPGRFERLVAGSYVETVRNLPPLVLVFIVYFFVGDRIMAYLGIEQFVRSLPANAQEALTFFLTTPARLSGFLAGLATLVLYEAAYITEIVRAGIQSLERGQWEAAHALGMTRLQQLRFVIMPQAFQRILPPLGGQLISTIKDSAIVSVISIPELTFRGSELMSATYLTFEVWITVMALYFLLTFTCSLGIRRLEKLRQTSS